MKMSIEVVDLLQAAHNGYFKILMENYPSANRDDTHTFAAFGPPELCELATEVHACAIALGKEARDRLLYIGLDVLYPFDNPVDLYNWRSHVLAKKTDHTIYASIAIRIDGELKRLRRALELGGMQAYAGWLRMFYSYQKQDTNRQVTLSGLVQTGRKCPRLQRSISIMSA